MGLDVELYVVGEKEITDEQIDAFNEYMKYRVGPDGEFEILTRYPYKDSEQSNVQCWWNSLMRFYGQGYSRGPWPTLYVVIKSLINHFPEHDIIYTHDCGGGPDGLDGITDADLAKMWEHYFSPSGDSYRRRD